MLQLYRVRVSQNAGDYYRTRLTKKTITQRGQGTKRSLWSGGEFFLKSHANEGIVSAQYDMGGMRFYELNVGWHHGESGGPILRLDDPVTAFSVMQHYRNIKSPHGTVVGPHRGRSLVGVEQSIRNFGANVVE